MSPTEMLAAADELRRSVRKRLHERGTPVHVIIAAEQDYLGPLRDLAVEEIGDGYVSDYSCARWYLESVRTMAEAEERSRAAEQAGAA